MKNYAKIAVFVLGFMLYSWTSLGQESFNVGAQQNNLEKQDSLKTRIEQELSANKQVSAKTVIDANLCLIGLPVFGSIV